MSIQLVFCLTEQQNSSAKTDTGFEHLLLQWLNWIRASSKAPTVVSDDKNPAFYPEPAS